MRKKSMSKYERSVRNIRDELIRDDLSENSRDIRENIGNA